MKKLTMTLIAVLGVATLVHAEGRVEERRPFSSRGELSIENIAGSVTVVGWDKEEIEIVGDLGRGTRGLDISGDRNRMSIEVEIDEYHGHDFDVDIDHDNDRDRDRDRRERRDRDRGDRHEHNVGSSDLEIRLPRGARVEVETIAAWIEVSGMSGPVEAESVSGRVKITGRPETVQASSVSGDVVVTVDGVLESGEFETVVGDVEFEADLSDRGRYEFETVNGSVILKLPSSVSASFDIASFNGDISNEFGPRARRTSEYLNSLELRFTTGGGGARVNIETLNGNIRLVKN